MPRPPHSPWLDLPNDIWGWVQIMNFLIVQLKNRIQIWQNKKKMKRNSLSPICLHTVLATHIQTLTPTTQVDVMGSGKLT
jgi:hypothetical protein